MAQINLLPWREERRAEGLLPGEPHRSADHEGEERVEAEEDVGHAHVEHEHVLRGTESLQAQDQH